MGSLGNNAVGVKTWRVTSCFARVQ